MVLQYNAVTLLNSAVSAVHELIYNVLLCSNSEIVHQSVITIKFTTSYCYGFTMLLKVSHSFILPNAIKMLCVNTELLTSD